MIEVKAECNLYIKWSASLILQIIGYIYIERINGKYLYFVWNFKYNYNFGSMSLEKLENASGIFTVLIKFIILLLISLIFNYYNKLLCFIIKACTGSKAGNCCIFTSSWLFTH